MSTEHFVLVQNISFAHKLCVHMQHIFNVYTYTKWFCTRILFGTHIKYYVREQNCLARVQNPCENPSLLGRNQPPQLHHHT